MNIELFNLFKYYNFLNHETDKLYKKFFLIYNFNQKENFKSLIAILLNQIKFNKSHKFLYQELNFIVENNINILKLSDYLFKDIKILYK